MKEGTLANSLVDLTNVTLGEASLKRTTAKELGSEFKRRKAVSSGWGNLGVHEDR